MSINKIPFDQFLEDFDRSILNGNEDVQGLIARSNCPYLKRFVSKKEMKNWSRITRSSDVITTSNY